MLQREPEALKQTGVLKVVPHNSAKKQLWARIFLARLTDRSWDDFHPPKLRLLLYLQIKSRRGKRQVHLTNKLAAEIGLSRQQKARCLRELEARPYHRDTYRPGSTIDRVSPW